MTFGDPSGIGFWDIVQKQNRQTDKQGWKPSRSWVLNHERKWRVTNVTLCYILNIDMLSVNPL